MTCSRCVLGTNDSSPTVWYELDVRPLICDLQKYGKMLHVRGLGKREGMLPLSNGNDATQRVAGVGSQKPPRPPSALRLTHPTHVDILVVARRLGLDMCVCVFSDYVYVVDD